MAEQGGWIREQNKDKRKRSSRGEEEDIENGVDPENSRSSLTNGQEKKNWFQIPDEWALGPGNIWRRGGLLVGPHTPV